MTITPEQVEACRIHIEREHSYGEPGRVGGDETLAIIAGYQSLLTEVGTLRQRADQAEAKVRDYENAITWDTTCLRHSALLDECRRQEERAEKAERERDALRQSIDQRAPAGAPRKLTDEEIHTSFLSSEEWKDSPTDRAARIYDAQSGGAL